MPAVVVPAVAMPRHDQHGSPARGEDERATIAHPFRPAPPAMVMPPMELPRQGPHEAIAQGWIYRANVPPPIRPPPNAENERLNWSAVEEGCVLMNGMTG